ncbi:hypothetical protein BS50DRAFT_328577 [Corynespora cassiicola Philippines]|uniref:Uncharacterized protein n=1 Tax=Corynespora cassiicola Philippines TaxID=1448308 RepID=A0A2T2NU38_CORCC|nr:hypothetical protein BS50DRAFT_328577 [Corynespora cassiicola Philippines]
MDRLAAAAAVSVLPPRRRTSPHNPQRQNVQKGGIPQLQRAQVRACVACAGACGTRKKKTDDARINLGRLCVLCLCVRAPLPSRAVREIFFFSSPFVAKVVRWAGTQSANAPSGRYISEKWDPLGGMRPGPGPCGSGGGGGGGGGGQTGRQAGREIGTFRSV